MSQNIAQVPNKLASFFDNVHFERDGDLMILNFGPQHPSAHGQLRLILELDGEKIIKARPDIGYLHRGFEKLAENANYAEFVPTTDRLDYIASLANNHSFAHAVEVLLGVENEIPRRAQIIRVLLLEVVRLCSHLLWLGTHALDVGAMSVFLYAFREREWGMDLIEDYCGARLTHNAIRIGGVPLDLPPDWIAKAREFCKKIYSAAKLYNGILEQNRIWRARLENVGIINQQTAKDWGLSGVMLRGSGIEWDLRKEMPYEIYPEIDFDVPISDGCDAYARYLCYMEEFNQSARIIEQAATLYEKCDESAIMCEDMRYFSAPKERIMSENYSLMRHFVLITQGMKAPKGEIYAATESPKGELGFFINSQGDSKPYRLKIRTPSFFHTGFLEEMLPGHYLADAVALIGNLNVIFGEIDR